MSLPMVALRGITILPEMVRHFDVSRPKSVAAIDEVVEGEQKIFLTAQKDGEVEDPGRMCIRWDVLPLSVRLSSCRGK